MDGLCVKIMLLVIVFSILCSAGCVGPDPTGISTNLADIGDTIPTIGWVLSIFFPEEESGHRYAETYSHRSEFQMEDGTIVRDLKDPSMSTNILISEGYEAQLYNNYLTFSGGPSYDLKLMDVVPAVYITTVYYVDEVTSLKAYTSEYGEKEWVEEWITQPDPNAFFEIIVYDSNGEIVGVEGYGGRRYDGGSSDTIRILRGGDYTISMNGQAIGVEVSIVYK